MNIGFLFSGIFWGGVLVLLGLSIIIKVVFHIDLPVVRIVFALVLIFLGVRLLAGSFGRGSSIHYEFRHKVEIHSGGAFRSYKTIFSDETIDLTDIVLKDKTITVDIDTVMGATRVIFDPSVPAEMTLTAVGADGRLPGHPNVTFGSTLFKTKSFKEGKPHLKVRANVVFGKMEFVEKRPAKK